MRFQTDLPEARLNPLLRRVDWRFLLADPWPAKTLCFATGALRDAVTLVSGQVSVPDQFSEGGVGDPRNADLAVAVNPDHRTLQQAWTGLRPGGACYTEWYAASTGEPRRIRSRLEAVGFEQVRCYVAWHSPAACQLWLPLEARGAWEFLHRRPLPFPRLLRRLRGRITRRAGSLAVRLGMRRPICALAQKPYARAGRSVGTGGPEGPVRGEPAIVARSERHGAEIVVRNEPHFMRIIRDQWTAWGLPATPARLSWVLLTGGNRAVCKVVGLAFAEPDPRPHVAVKMARVPEAVLGLTREAAALRALAAVPGGMPGAPRLLFEADGEADAPQAKVIGETAVAGAPLSSVVRRANYRELALKATAWSAHLACRMRSLTATPSQHQLVEPVLDEFSEWFAPILDPGMMRVTRELLAGLPALPVVCEQRDFSPWNVFLTPTRDLAVLDWESSALHGLPALDLLYFLTYLGFSLAGLGFTPRSADEATRFLQSYRDGLEPSTFTGRVHQECLAAYCEKVGIDAGMLPRLRVFLWLLHARSEYRHFIADEGGAVRPATLRRSFFARLWAEEVRRVDVA